MNTTTTTPPQIKRSSLPYSDFYFQEIISRISDDDVPNISIEVWAEDGNNCIELLRSGLSDKEFERMASKATYMIFIGPQRVLQSIGVA